MKMKLLAGIENKRIGGHLAFVNELKLVRYAITLIYSNNIAPYS